MYRFFAQILWIKIYLISLLPMEFLYFFGRIFAKVLSKIFFYRYDVIDENLLSSFPEKQNLEIDIIKEKYYSYLGEFVAEVIKSVSASDAFYKNHVLIDEATQYYLKQLKEKNKNAVIVLGHFGNWEWAAHILGIEGTIPQYAIFRNIKSKTINHLIRKIRTRKNINIIAENDFLSIKNIPSPYILAMVADQSPTGQKKLHWQQFLSQNTAFTTTPFRIATYIEAQQFYCSIIRIKRGFYKISLTPLNDQNPIEEYVNYLEKDIITTPSTWLWSHKRWKIKKSELSTK